MGLLLWCAPALAHARLLETAPADQERLSRPPERVQLRFSEPIEAEFTPVRVAGPQGDRVDRDDALVDPDDRGVLAAELEELPEDSRAGAYTVEWRVTSADGHPVSGTYVFDVSGAGSDEPGAEGIVEPEEQPSDQAEPGQQQDAGAGSTHIVHVVGLGLGALVLLVLAISQGIRKKG